MKKVFYVFTMIFLIVFIMLFIFVKSHIVSINMPIEEFSLDDESIENNYNTLTEVLSKKNLLYGYKLSSVEYYPNKHLGYIVYSNNETKSVIFIHIKSDIFTTAVKYDRYTKEAKRLFGYPIDENLIKVYSSGLNSLIKEMDINFNSDNIEYIGINKNVERDKVIWNCIYYNNGYKNIEVDANTGEVIRIMDS